MHLYIYSTNIGTGYFKHGIYSPFFSSLKCSLFHNSNVFGFCIIHILYIYSTNIGTEYFKHGIYSPFLSPQNAVCFIILTCLVPVLFTFYIQGVLKLKKNNSGAKRLTVRLWSPELTVEYPVIINALFRIFKYFNVYTQSVNNTLYKQNQNFFFLETFN